MSKWEQKKQKGNDEFRKKNYPAAISLYTEAITIDPTQDTLYNNRGLCYMNLNKHELSKQDFNKAIQLNPSNIKALRRLSAVHIAEGDVREAEVYLKRCVDLDSTDTALSDELLKLQHLIKIYDEFKSTYNTKEWSKCYELGKTLIQRVTHCYWIKEAYFECLIHNNNSNTESTSDIDNALLYYKKYFDDTEKQKDNIQYLLSYLYCSDGKYDKSKQILTALLNRSKDESILSKTKSLTSKLETIQQAKDSANFAFKSNNFANAITLYTKLLSMDTNNKLFNGIILANRALCHYKLKDFFNALHDLNDSILLNNKYWKSYLRRANVYIQLKYADKAKDDLRKVIELDPTNRDAITILDDIEREEKKGKRKNLYNVLELNKYATQEDIRKAFKRLALKYHPDKNNYDNERKEYAEKMFKEINEAYNILSDINKREIYDQGGNVDDLNNNIMFSNNNNNNNSNNNNKDYYNYSQNNNNDYKYEYTNKKRERSRGYK
jgi:DnaJ family protein C protein 7